ncbi:MAG TPA: hypothetical protein VEV87_09095 [Chitinophagaceae bacterium]|nr:hypothetical protein [Chitinophagaceae bacterium]
MEIIRTILESNYFADKPPVLIDIGASGELHQKWKPIAPYSICIAFDADDREFRATEHTNKAYKKLISLNRIVTSEPVATADFYLTVSPFCSSLLQPSVEELQPWIFSDLFKVEKRIQLAATTIKEALNGINIDYIDWFKTDTQGTDLRLFTTLPPALSQNILAAEFEPGILDAYSGEDKLYQVMQVMERESFWLSTIEVKGVQRLRKEYVQEIGQSSVKRILRKSPGWAEVTYLRHPKSNSARQQLLLYIFALMEKQYGYALEVMDIALRNESNDLFTRCKEAVLKRMKKEKWKLPLVVFKRQFNKLFSNIND